MRRTPRRRRLARTRSEHQPAGLNPIHASAALGSRRYWPIWMVGFHIVAVASHLGTIVVPDFTLAVYRAVGSLWAVPMLLAMVLGIELDRKALRIAREPATLEPSRADLAGAARRYLRSRRQRESAFPSDLFADPAWDVLLDLFACGAEGKPVTVTDACIAANVPSSTTLR